MQTKPPPEPHFSIFQALWRAPLFGRPFWQDVIWRWKGWGILYLHLVVAIVWIPITVQLEWQFVSWVDNDAEAWAEDFPGFYIEAGQVISDAYPMPYVWDDPDTGEPLFVVDTTGSTPSLEGRPERWLLTETSLFVRDDDSGIEREVPLNWVPFFVLDEHMLLLFLGDAKLYFPVLFYLCAFLVSVTWRCCQCVGYGAIAWAIGGFKAVDFGQGARIAAMAITTVLWLDMIEDLLPFDVPAWGPICFLIALAYLWWGVKVAKEGPPEDVLEWRGD